MSVYDTGRARMRPGDRHFREYAIGYQDAMEALARYVLCLLLMCDPEDIEEWLRDVICRHEEWRR
jgi:hypothetical protein